MNYRKYIKSDAWYAKQQAKLEASNGKCECEGGCIRDATQIHHLHYDTLGNEGMEDLLALCPKCHMAKSPKVRNFYGNPVRNCCLVEGQQELEKILPYNVWNEANFHYITSPTELYDKVALELQTDPVIVALLDNCGLMIACGDMSVTDKVTQVINNFVDVVHDDHDGGDIYVLKPDVKKIFLTSAEELLEQNPDSISIECWLDQNKDERIVSDRTVEGGMERNRGTSRKYFAKSSCPYCRKPSRFKDPSICATCFNEGKGTDEERTVYYNRNKHKGSITG